jgi:hypothetical protein
MHKVSTDGLGNLNKFISQLNFCTYVVQKTIIASSLPVIREVVN